MDTHEQAAVPICHYDGIQRGSYFGGYPIRRTEVEARVRKFNNEKAACKDEVTGEMIKGGDMLVN